jgi:hypothetical protein
MDGDKQKEDKPDKPLTSIDEPKESDEPLPPTYLTGTTWKLNGIVNAKTGELKNLEPTDCEACYTIAFDTDYTFTVLSIWHRLKVDLLNLDPSKPLNEMLLCEKYDKDNEDYCVCHDFRSAIMTIESFSVSDEELRLNTYGGYYYLSFAPYNGDNPSTSRRGTQWKLIGMVDVETGDVNELEPKDCSECYTLTFWGDYVFVAKSIWAGQLLDLSNLNIAMDPTKPWGYEDEDSEPIYAEKRCNDTYNPLWDGECVPYEDSFLFRCGIAYTKDYELTSDELKLFFIYQEKSYYFLFKLVYM